MKILFINGSANVNGNTAELANELLAGQKFETLNLIDYRLNVYGQKLSGDQLGEIIDRIKVADQIVIGSPVYWHNLAGSVRVLLDRFYDEVIEDEFAGKKLYFIFQGAAPEKWMIDDGSYSVSRFAKRYGFIFIGTVTNIEQAHQLSLKN